MATTHRWTAPRRTRDSQRRLCYRWCDTLRRRFDWLAAPLLLADAQHIADQVWGHYATAAGHAPNTRVTVTRYPSRGGRTYGDAFYAGLHIRLADQGATLGTLLHELAHLVCGDPLVGGAHGPVFCRLLSEFCDEYAGIPAPMARYHAPLRLKFLIGPHPFQAGAPKSPRQDMTCTIGGCDNGNRIHR